uniref:N(4)-(beta-N-acetylglucosaminyl)-L-asparaginase n=1 Tax=Elaeophora elaphi TaxID=1147741 RepID=A0A0R3S1F4_9BILA
MMIWFQALIYFYILLRNCQSEVPLVITTWGTDDFQAATRKAFWTLMKTHDRMESLLEGLTECEQLQCDGTVGFGGSPDENGETRLDALVYDGLNHEMGAVGSLPNVKNAARVAYAVMKYTKHSILVGEHAADFAVEMGFKRESLCTNSSNLMHEKWIEQNCQPNYRKNVSPDPSKFCGPYKPANDKDRFTYSAKSNHWNIKVNRRSHDTIGMIVIDFEYNIAAGTSTNGANHKVPGRIGDSPVPGAGAYADNDVGAAVSTGDGDIMMRFVSSFQTVHYIREGKTPTEAAEITIHAISRKYPNFMGAIVAVNKKGQVGAACHGMDFFNFCVKNQNFTKVKILSVRCI